MTAKILHFTTLVCDGCGTPFDGGEDGGRFIDSLAARIVAHGMGWTFPHKVNKQGSQVKRTSDVCPKCLDGWVPQVEVHWTERRRNS